MSNEATTVKTSRVGKRPVDLPKGVQVSISGSKIDVKGPKGSLSRTFPAGVAVKQEGEQLNVTTEGLVGRDAPRLQGMTRALVNNMVEGCANGFTKTLELVGTGYRAELKGQVLFMSVGFSKPKEYPVPTGVSVDIPKDSKGQVVVLTGADKEVVGQYAASVRNVRPPEPYGGKGVRYRGERIREKAGKTGK
ncbi:MAG: 50S ribosomal protein L6 [Myxococcota bacterium]